MPSSSLTKDYDYGQEGSKSLPLASEDEMP